MAAIAVLGFANGATPASAPAAQQAVISDVPTTPQSTERLQTPNPTRSVRPSAQAAQAPSPTPDPTPTPPPLPTPKPTPRVITHEGTQWVDEDRLALRGKTGTSIWPTVLFDPATTLLRWNVTAGRSDCSIRWIVDPGAEGEKVAKTVKADRGDQVKGSKKLDTDEIYQATVTVRSTCPKWVVTMVEAPTPRPAAQSNCDPNYAGACVPRVSYDLDCADIGHSVQVVGSDPHRLDSDNDGWGCESYP